MPDSVDSDKAFEAAQALLEERARRLRQGKEAEDDICQEMMLFSICEQNYAIALEELSEIRKIRNLTPLPLVRNPLLGVMNVRGRVVTLYNITEKESGKADSVYGLVGADDIDHIAVIADNIIGTSKVSATDIKPPPLSFSDRDYIRGVGNDGLIYISLENFPNNQSIYPA